jgi:hypothetical protein
MQKHELATQLRHRQYNYGQVDRSTIDALSDDDIIDSYITCSCCGKIQVNEQQLQSAIEIATDADSFFQICDALSQSCETQATIH